MKAARRLRREGFLARRLTLSADCLDAPAWTASTLVARANDDLTCLDALSALWAALASGAGPGRPVPDRRVVRQVHPLG